MSDIPVATLPSEVEFILSLGILKLLIAKYQPHFGDQSSFLGAAILNFAFLMPPSGIEEVERYRAENACLIEQQARLINLDFRLANAFSLLYSFMLIRLGPTDSERSSALTEMASELLIILRAPEEICNTNDPWEFLDFVRKCALDLIGGEPNLPPDALQENMSS